MIKRSPTPPSPNLEIRTQVGLAGLPLEALKAARMVAWEFDPVTERIQFSENAADVFGLLHGAVSQSASEGYAQIHPEDFEEHRIKVNAALEKGESYVSRYRLIRPIDQEIIWLEERGHASAASGSLRLVGVAMDVTERKTTEERNRFLVELDDAVRPLTDPAAVVQTAAELLGRHLGADRCAYADIEEDEDTMNLTGNYNRHPGVKSIVGRLKFADFGAEVLRLMRENKPYVVHNVDTHQPPVSKLDAYRLTQIQAVICVPLHKAGRFVAAMAVHSLTPRRWHPDEVELVQLVAARSWESIERIRIERTLRENEERYHSLFNSIESGFCIVQMHFDEAGRPFDYTFIEVNPAFARQTGLIDAAGKTIRSLAPAHEQHWFDIYGNVALTGQPIQFENAATALNRFFEVYAFRIGDPSAHRVAILFTEISERRRVENALRESESLLRTVTSQARVGLVMVDQDRRYRFANQSYREILGLKESNILGRRISEVLGDVYDQIEPRLDLAFAGQRVTYELHIPSRDRSAEERFYEVVYEPRVADTPDPYVVVVIVDITERKRVQQTLEKLVAERTAKLRETVHDLEAFSYSIAHDMRAPLRSMQGFSNLLVQDFAATLPAEGRDYLRRIAASASRLDQLIQDVLTYSRIVRQDLPLQNIDLEKLIADILHSYPHFHAPGIQIDVRHPLPHVFANTAGLTQIISNLLGNAIKFIKPGDSPRVRIWAEKCPRDSKENPLDCIRLWVEDNGIGISAEHQSRIFGMFQRLNRPEQFEGTGIGLAIVRKAAERMGGAVGVQSQPGQGSRFWVDLQAVL